MAVGFTRRTIALLVAAAVGLATFVFLIGGGGTVAHAQTTITAHIGDHECNEDEWHFLINGLASEEDAPESITVTWVGGATEVVELTKFTGGVAHYTTTSNLGIPVLSATADIDAAFNNFVLSHGPCDTSTPSPTPSETPSEKPSETPSETPSEKPSETPSEKPSETPSEKPSETPAPVPTAVPGGANPSGGSAAGLLGLALATSGVVAGTMMIARRRLLHDS